MAFVESPRFPTAISYGSRGGPTFSTDVVTYGNGSEYRNSLWSSPLMRYEVEFRNMRRDRLLSIYEFFMALKGMGDGFRAKDVNDFTSKANGVSAQASTDVTIGTGDDTETAFQLVKLYTKGPNTTARRIMKPVSGTVIVAVNGVTQVEGPSDDYEVDYSTGIITFAAPPGDGLAITAGFEFDVPVRAGKDDLSDIAYAVYSATDTDIASIASFPLIELRLT